MKHACGHILRTLAIVVVLARVAAADGISRDELEAISGGRGGTNIAQSDNGAVLLANPAGILNVDGDGLAEVAVDGLITDLHFSNPLNDRTSAHDRPMALPLASIIEKSPGGDWAFGFGVFAPAGFAAGWNFNNAVMGNQSYQSFGSLLKVLPGVSYRLAPGLSIGGTFGLAASYVALDSPFAIQTGPFAGTPVLMHLKGDGVSPTWSVGMQYDLTTRTTIGAAYTSEDRMNLDGHLHAQVFGFGPPIATEFNSRLNIVWPQSVGVGIKHMLTCNQRLSADVVWLNWSHSFNTADLQLTDSTNPLFTALLGPKFEDTIALHWKDSASVRLGYEWFYSECSVVRAGYVYNTPQIPSSTLTPLIPAILEHDFTIGWGTWYQCWHFDVAYQYSFGPIRDVGTSIIQGGDFSNSRLSAQAHWLGLSLTRQF